MKTHLAVIGAGPGGYVAAFHAADLGMQLTLIDADPNPGGVCTFRGRVSLDDIARQAQPNPLHPQHGAHHHG